MSKGTKQESSEEPSAPSAVMERLNWRLAWRDDGRVAQALYAGEEIEEMHELSEAGLLDEFFVFLEEIGLMAVVEQMALPGVQRVLVPTVQFVLLYLLKVLYGAESMNALPRRRLEQTRGCPTQNEEEARSTQPAEPGRQHQQAESGANGATL